MKKTLILIAGIIAINLCNSQTNEQILNEINKELNDKYIECNNNKTRPIWKKLIINKSYLDYYPIYDKKTKKYEDIHELPYNLKWDESEDYNFEKTIEPIKNEILMYKYNNIENNYILTPIKYIHIYKYGPMTTYRKLIIEDFEGNKYSEKNYYIDCQILYKGDTLRDYLDISENTLNNIKEYDLEKIKQKTLILIIDINKLPNKSIKRIFSHKIVSIPFISNCLNGFGMYIGDIKYFEGSWKNGKFQSYSSSITSENEDRIKNLLNKINNY